VNGFPAWQCVHPVLREFRNDPGSALKFCFSDDTFDMPRKIRQLMADLEKHGFVDRGGKGSHRNFLHPSGVKITLSGAPGDDAKHYQERDLKRAIQKVQS
jgi:predicted RNA binding protein YcfA (HicA-like mRNA interferase family)